MGNNKIMTALIALGLVAGSIAAAAPAYADNVGTLPSGCTLSPSAPKTSSSKVVYGGSGYCTKASGMDIRLVHNYDKLPDARVNHYTKYTTPNFSGSYSQCDNGGTTQYYTELAFYFTSGAADVQKVSKTVSLTHC